jgi:hypothetical protein
MNQPLRRAAIPLLSMMLAACGGGEYVPQTNHAPVANAGPAQSVAVGSSVALTGSGTDAEADLLSYSWTMTKPVGSNANLLNYHFSTPTFPADVAGVYTATLIVNDGKLDSAPSTVTVIAH